MKMSQSNLSLMAVLAALPMTSAQFENSLFRIPKELWSVEPLVIDRGPSVVVRLKNGIVREPQGLAGVSYIKLVSVSNGPMLGNGRGSYLVALHVQSDGTMSHGLLYILPKEQRINLPVVVLHTGDRAFGGLRRVYARDGDLVVELFSPHGREGDCCATRITRHTFASNAGGVFRETTPAEELETSTAEK